MNIDDHIALLRQVKYDLSVAQTRITEAIEFACSQPRPINPDHICSFCGTHQRGVRSLAEHKYHVHDGPVPEHYLEAERLAGLDELQA